VFSENCRRTPVCYCVWKDHSIAVKLDQNLVNFDFLTYRVVSFCFSPTGSLTSMFVRLPCGGVGVSTLFNV